MKLDQTDLEIVRLLQQDGRRTHEQISREIHLSRPAVHDRIRRLEAAGVIRGYRAEVDWEALGLPLTAFVWVRVAGSGTEAAHQILGLTAENALVEECHRVIGEWCLLVQIRAASALAFQDLLDRIGGLPGAQSTMSTIALSTYTRTPEIVPPVSA
jgi:Lrp/AsnC family leucine-responsive transcriptional regulator